MADYSEQQLIGALRKADAAGDTAAAKAIARRIQSMRQGGVQAAPQQPSAPPMPIQDMAPVQAERPDFSGVSGRMDSTAAAPDSGLMRDIKGGARSVMQGAAGLLGAIGGDAVNHYLVPGQQPSYRDAAGALADRMGLPRPENASERVMGDVGEALTGTALTMGGGALLNAGRNVAAQGANRLGKLLTAQPKVQIVGTATGAGAAGQSRESGGSQGQQLAAGLVGGLVPGAVSATSGATVRGLVRGTSGETMQKNINAFQALGTTPSVGQASGNWLLQGAENLLGGAPTSAGVVNRFAERQAEDIGAGLQKTADDFYRNASGERAGRAVERGIDTFAGNVNATRKALYWQADRTIPNTTTLPLTNTQRALSDLTALTPGAESTTAIMVNPKIAQLAKTVGEDLNAAQLTGSGGMPYSAVKDIRTRIGAELADFSLTTDKPTAQYKRLYAALSQDLEQAARQQGPDAEQAVRRANNYFKVSQERLDQVQRVVDKNGGPEKVFSAVMEGTRDGGTTLRAVMQSLPKEGQQAVTAAVIKRMGLATPGVQDAEGATFSAQTFLTNWNKVSPEAKRALFDRHGPSFTRDMDRIASVAQNIRDGSKVFANPAGTANRTAAIGYGLSLGGSLITGSLPTAGGLIAAGVIANVLARKMTNPDVVRWLARSTEMPVGALVSQASVLRAIGESHGDEEIIALADALLEKQRPDNNANADN